MNFYNNKVVWITGASSGIGEALSYELVKQGARLIISARRTEELERLRKQAGENNVFILPLDLEATGSFSEKVKEAINAFGHIDIMIHNGGISQRSYVNETLPEVQRRVMEIDYFSYTELTRLLLPHFEQRRSGHWVVVSSVMAKIGTPKRSAYAAAKHALHGYFDCLRAEVWKDNIKVTLVMPGYIRTNITLSSVTGTGEKLKKIAKDIRNGYPVDKAARQILKAVQKGKYEKYIGKPYSKEWMAVFLMRMFPSLTIRILRNAAPD